MKYLVLSDIHSNIQALNAVLAETTYDRVAVLGDLVGYGADPNAVIDRIKGLQGVVIRGNHDRAACDGKLSGCWSYSAISSILWTMGELTTENRAYLMTLPEGPLVVDDTFEICHGSLEDEDVYVLHPANAQQSLDVATKRVCFFGHTHLPIAYSRLFRDIFTYAPTLEDHRYDLKLRHMRSYLINPGSVGQPRDGDNRAAFIVFDSESMHVSFRRIEYDVAGAQAKIEGTELPRQLAARLAIVRFPPKSGRVNCADYAA